MQYFTFLGTGGKNGYREACTYFENDPENIEIVRYIQEMIYQKHKNEVSEVLVFLTPEVKKTTFPDLQEILKDTNITEISLPKDVDTEDFVKLLQQYLKQDGEAIFDVTHSFRHLPMKFLFALKYAEQMKNTRIHHIYYGMMKYFETDQEECCITDVMKDYETQKISERLAQFDRSLTAHAEDWKDYVTTDRKVEAFLDSLADFNEMLELCEFDACLKVARTITETARSLAKQPNEYYMLLPLTNKIEEKLNSVLAPIKTNDQKSALIKVLLAHQRFQIAVTFTDEFFREELVKTALGSISPKHSMEEIAALNNIPPKFRSSFGYNCSQYLREVVFLDNTKTAPNWKDYEPYLDFSQSGIQKIKTLGSSMENRKLVKDFTNKVRNRINHGNTIREKQDLQRLTEGMLSIVDAL